MPEQQQKKVKTVRAVRSSTVKEASPQAQTAPPAPQPQGVQASNVLSFDDLEYHASQRERRWVSESRKKPFYLQWWFWLAVALLVISIVILAVFL